jgi:hypothetical protein
LTTSGSAKTCPTLTGAWSESGPRRQGIYFTQRRKERKD